MADAGVNKTEWFQAVAGKNFRKTGPYVSYFYNLSDWIKNIQQDVWRFWVNHTQILFQGTCVDFSCEMGSIVNSFGFP